ncbi:MAG: OB-fold domain-containing protein [Alphaproteobacteria bacterium]|jgi:hypothetical protein|nr:OB-fold domain-containing protein [Alphaproteobacteria bacterium]MDP6565748.1 OB-fold domain-containing protein [Alphaproteobacteria bacterium]MDP6815344.1 OB-fold domain-containing protein [Alphaproteobacteria bacterium]
MSEQGETVVADRFPEPRRTLDAEPFWRGIAQGRLLFQRCGGCRTAVWPPRSYCPYCDAPGLSWEESSGTAEIYSFSTVMRPPTPVWNDKAPYTVGLVRLAEGYYLFTEIDEEWQGIAIGQKVEVTFPPRDVPLPIFKYARNEG